MSAALAVAAVEPATPPGSKHVVGRDGCGEADDEWSPPQALSERAQRRKRRAENVEEAQGRAASQPQHLPGQVGPAPSECSCICGVRISWVFSTALHSFLYMLPAAGALFTSYSLALL